LLVNSKFICFYIFLFALKARLKELKFEFCQLHCSGFADKLAIKWQNFARARLQFKFAFKLKRPYGSDVNRARQYRLHIYNL